MAIRLRLVRPILNEHVGLRRRLVRVKSLSPSAQVRCRHGQRFLLLNQHDAAVVIGVHSRQIVLHHRDLVVQFLDVLAYDGIELLLLLRLVAIPVVHDLPQVLRKLICFLRVFREYALFARATMFRLSTLAALA